MLLEDDESLMMQALDQSSGLVKKGTFKFRKNIYFTKAIECSKIDFLMQKITRQNIDWSLKTFYEIPITMKLS